MRFSQRLGMLAMRELRIPSGCSTGARPPVLPGFAASREGLQQGPWLQQVAYFSSLGIKTAVASRDVGRFPWGRTSIYPGQAESLFMSTTDDISAESLSRSEAVRALGDPAVPYEVQGHF